MDAISSEQADVEQELIAAMKARLRARLDVAALGESPPIPFVPLHIPFVPSPLAFEVSVTRMLLEREQRGSLLGMLAPIA